MATATEINITGAANDLGIDPSTVVSYLEWLRTVFLIYELPPWSRNFTSRAVRRPKLHVTDTGLAANLLGVGAAMLAPATAPATGALLETFTVTEIARQLTASGDRVGMFHYRDQQKREIDLVLERRDGAVVAVGSMSPVLPPSATSAMSAGFGTRWTPQRREPSGSESCSTPDHNP